MMKHPFLDQGIFDSYLKLSFKNKSFTTFYNNHYFKHKMISSNIFLPWYIVLSSTMLIMIWTYNNNDASKYNERNYYSYLHPIFWSLVFLDIGITIVYFTLLRKSEKIVNYFPIVSYSLLSLHLILLKILLEVFYEIEPINIYFLTIIEYVFKVIFHFSGFWDFINSIAINIIVPGIVIGMYILLNKLTLLIMDNGASFIIWNLALIASSYVITIINKKNIYYTCRLYSWHMKNEMIWNKLNVGYMKIEENDIITVNKSLIETLMLTKEIQNIVQKSGDNKMTTEECLNDNAQGDGVSDDMKWKIILNEKEKVFEIWFGDIHSNESDFNHFFNNSNSNDSAVESCNENNIDNWNNKRGGNAKIINIIGNHNTNHNRTQVNDSTVKLKEISAVYLDKINSSNNTKTHNRNNPEWNQILPLNDREMILNQDIIPSNFVFITYQIILCAKRKKIIYEVYCRYENNEFEFIFNDVSRTKEYEEKNFNFKIQNIFLTKIAHEFKNPLVCVHELSTQLKDSLLTLDNEPAKADIMKINNLVQTYNEYWLLLIKDWDYFTNSHTPIMKSHYHALERTTISTKDLITFCQEISKCKISRMKKANNVKFFTHVDSGVPEEFISDDAKIKQIWLNLISNAIKNTKSGLVSMHVEKIKTENSLQLCIKDTGKGIDEDTQQYISKLFTSKKPENNLLYNEKEQETTNDYKKGLGLYIVKNLVDSWNSKIFFESVKNEGSKFWFTISWSKGLKSRQSSFNLTLPPKNTIDVLARRNSLRSTTTVSISEGNLKWKIPKWLKSITKTIANFNVIVADDEEWARKSCIRVWMGVARTFNVNITIIDACDGVEIWNKIYQSHFGVDTNKIHAVITDQTMKYWNGSTCRNILLNIVNERVECFFYIVTAYNTKAKYLQDKKIDGVFSKPFMKSDAETIIKQWLSKHF